MTNSFFVCRFLYDGDRINDDDTPGTLGMEDNGIYHVFFAVRWRFELTCVLL